MPFKDKSAEIKYWKLRYQKTKKSCTDCGALISATSFRCRKCMGNSRQREQNPNWKMGQGSYHNYRMKICERCGKINSLLVHHKNRNHDDNRIENLETLCQSCHATEHAFKNNFGEIKGKGIMAYGYVPIRNKQGQFMTFKKGRVADEV